MQKTYTLQRNLPDAKKGANFILNTNGKYYLDGNILGSYWDAGYVENNPEWFLLKPQQSLAYSIRPFKDEKSPASGYEYILSVSNNGIPLLKAKEVLEAINIVLSDGQSTLDNLLSNFKKKECEILLWKNFNGSISNKKFVAPCKIHAVLRLIDNTKWAVGEETQHGIINKIEEGDDNPLVFYVGERNYPLFIYEAKKI